MFYFLYCCHPSQSQHFFLDYHSGQLTASILMLLVCSSENNQIDPFDKEIGSCHFSSLSCPMAFNYTLNKNQSSFPDLVSDSLFYLIFYYSFPCSLCFSHSCLLALHICSSYGPFPPLGLCFCCFLCLERGPHRYSYGPMPTSFRFLSIS